MLRADYKLVAVARVLEVVNQTRCDRCQLVVLLQVFLYVSHFHHEVKTLEGVDDVRVIVICVFFEVALGDFSNKTYKIFELDAGEKVQLVLLQDLVGHKLERVVIENCFEVVHIEGSHVHFLKGHFHKLWLHVCLIDKSEKFGVYVLFCKKRCLGNIRARLAITFCVIIWTHFPAFIRTILMVYVLSRVLLLQNFLPQILLLIFLLPLKLLKSLCLLLVLRNVLEVDQVSPCLDLRFIFLKPESLHRTSVKFVC